MFQALECDWEGDETRLFGIPTLTGKDINEISGNGLLTPGQSGHKYLVLGVQLDIPILAFDIVSIINVSDVILNLFTF